MSGCWKILFVSAFVACLAGCQRENQSGQLLVRAISKGNYDIFKLSKGSDFEFVAEKRGVFNEPVRLTPGSYLIAADCSSRRVIIYPDQDIVLQAEKVEFKPVREPRPDDKFRIECIRQSSIQMTQIIKNRFTLFMFPGSYSLLINQVSQQLAIQGGGGPEVTQIVLAALNISRHPKQSDKRESVYFVSNQHEKIGLTSPQGQGKWQHLLPGEYVVEMNGTTEKLSIAASEEIMIMPGLLKFSLPDSIDIDKAESVLGSPLHVDLNDGHFLSYGLDFPVLEGVFTFRPSQYLRPRQDAIAAGEYKEIPLRVTEIESNCSPWDYTCIGAYEVSLYEQAEIYPIIKSFSDVPIVHLNEPLSFAVQGASRIRVPLISDRSFESKQIGRVRIRPYPVAEDGYSTDLLRVENEQKEFTNDIVFDRESVLVLPVGKYALANYVSYNRESGLRKRLVVDLAVEAGQELVYPVPVYLLPQKAKQISENNAKAVLKPASPGARLPHRAVEVL